MKRSFNKHMLRVGLTGALLLASKGALATCSFMDSRFNANNGSALNFGNVVVQRDTAVGSVIATLTDTALGGRNNFLECNATGYVTRWAAGGAFAPVVYNGETLYQSGITGLAFRITTAGAGSTAGRYGTGPLPRQITNLSCANSTTWWRLCGGTWGNLRVQLVKIAATTGSGPFTNGSLVQALVVGDTNIYNYTINTGTVRTVACSVTNNTISVPMGDVKNTVFSGAGSTSSATDFSIALNCDASTNVNVNIQAGSAGAVDASKGVLALDKTGAGDATGVGVQVLYNNAPVSLGTRFRVATTAADGAYAVPLQARYYQTAQALTPGQANANATFTMTYQ